MSSVPPLEIVPLGGLGEFGMNMMALRHGDSLLVLDAGLMFPEEAFLGVDIVVPDMAYLEESPGTLRGVVLTHGHEDHIGALPHLLQKAKAPVYGTRLTLGLARQRLTEYGMENEAELRTVVPRDRVQAGPFEVEFIQVTHSIPDSIAMAIRTPVGTIVHTADWKIDQTPVDGRGFDFRRFSELGDEGVLALMSDSTNAARKGFTPSERDVGRALAPILRGAAGRVVVTTFASNIHRLQQVIDIAAGLGRRVAFVGRSVSTNVRVCEELGYLRVPPGVAVEPRDVMRLPRDKVVLIASGSQGEPMSALSRIALDDHRDVGLDPGDLVVLSARRIPGNEKAITRLINHLCRRGADVLLDDTPGVHVSGHASREELKIMMALTRPRFFIPVHGDFQHLSQHAQLAGQAGIPKERVLVVESGDIVKLTSEEATVEPKGAPVGSVFIDGTLEEVDQIVIRDRQHIAEDGIVIPVLAINKRSGTIENAPEIISRGFVWVDNEEALFQEAGQVVVRAVESSTIEERSDWGFIKAKVHAELKRFLRKRTHRRPMIIPVILEV
ncbi:MAG TPA: ribonuclease J [Candidatus Polarisedimenticolia bacterium]|nr:ribonuclease J [Candidatus Polarisedimenticolia bacterium]